MKLETIPLFLSVIGGIGGLAGIAAFIKAILDVKAWKKTAKQADANLEKTKADLAVIYEAMATRSAEREDSQSKIIESQAKQIREFGDRITALEVENKKKDERISALENESRKKDEIVAGLKYKIECLEKGVESKDNYINILLNGIQTLIGQFKDIRIEPKWIPEPYYDSGIGIEKQTKKRGKK